MTKQCSKCKEVKDVGEFHKRNDRPNKLSCWCKKCRKEYALKNIENIKNYRRQWYKKNGDKVKEQNLYPRRKYGSYKYGAKRRNIPFSITFKQFMRFWQVSCYYCGDAIKTIGLDRVDNDKGYKINNIISCCEWCNKMKWKYNKKEFKQKILKVAKRIKNKTI